MPKWSIVQRGVFKRAWCAAMCVEVTFAPATGGYVRHALRVCAGVQAVQGVWVCACAGVQRRGIDRADQLGGGQEASFAGSAWMIG